MPTRASVSLRRKATIQRSPTPRFSHQVVCHSWVEKKLSKRLRLSSGFHSPAKAAKPLGEALWTVHLISTTLRPLPMRRPPHRAWDLTLVLASPYTSNHRALLFPEIDRPLQHVGRILQTSLGAAFLCADKYSAATDTRQVSALAPQEFGANLPRIMHDRRSPPTAARRLDAQAIAGSQAARKLGGQFLFTAVG